MTHDDTVRREFTRQAASFGDPGYAFADTRLIAWIHTHVPGEPGSIVLDVAGGTGQVARSYAPDAAAVVVADVTPEMLAVGKRECDAAGLRNLIFVHADASALPFLTDSFDLVVSRFAVHHFEQPAAPIAEMARVCRPGGRVAIVDLVAFDPALAAEHDELERMRDPSHARALPADELAALLERAGLHISGRTERDQPVPIERWLEQARTPLDVAEAIRRRVTAELEGGASTGMRPAVRDGALCQTQRWAILVARKPG
jgi:SAM-dependent methyltransferase